MKRDLATPLAPTFTDPVKKKKKKKKYTSHSVLTTLPKKKTKRKPPPKKPKGTWWNADDDTSNAPWTRPNKGSYPVVTSTSHDSSPKRKNK